MDDKNKSVHAAVDKSMNIIAYSASTAYFFSNDIHVKVVVCILTTFSQIRVGH